MSYTYDIYLNFKEVPYDFYDWNKNDILTHIKKIPLLKISEDNYVKCIKYNIRINDNLIKNIYKKTEIWNSEDKYSTCLLITDLNNIIALMFDDNGNSIKRSFLMIDEELEILDEIDNLEEISLEFDILNRVKYITKTRKQLKDIDFIKKELQTINEDRLKYVYYDCFGNTENNKENIIKAINNISDNSPTFQKLYNILKLTSTKKNKML